MSPMHRFHPSTTNCKAVTRAGNWQLTKKMIDGDAARAFLKISRTARSDSPTNLLSSYWQINSSRNRDRNSCTYFRTLDSHKIYSTFTSACSHQDSLTATRWTKEQDALWGSHTQPIESLRVQQRPFYNFPQFLDHNVLSSDIGITQRGCFEEQRAHGRRSDRV
jgi:hypothetical protein